jgi:hypothetical protein
MDILRFIFFGTAEGCPPSPSLPSASNLGVMRTFRNRGVHALYFALLSGSPFSADFLLAHIHPK